MCSCVPFGLMIQDFFSLWPGSESWQRLKNGKSSHNNKTVDPTSPWRRFIKWTRLTLLRLSPEEGLHPAIRMSKVRKQETEQL